MRSTLALILFVFISFVWGIDTTAQIKLTHNSCELVRTDMHSCSSSFIYWSRTFTLQDFNINANEDFIITEGEVGIGNTSWRPTIQFRVYAIDNNFPSSFSETDLIGVSQEIPLFWAMPRQPELINMTFDTPIVVPAGTERILVEVKKGIAGTGLPSSLAFIGGSLEDNDLSWQRGCVTGGATPVNGFVTATDMGRPNANFYINVTGNVNNVIEPFTLNHTTSCTETNKEFLLNNINTISAVAWDFGDPASGNANNSTLLAPVHDFSAPGSYSITALITQIDGTTYTLNETISVAEPPIAHPINDIHACENNSGSGISNNFDTSSIESQVLNGQTGVVVSYYDQNGNELPDPLPNPFTNNIPNSQVITVRVSDSSDLCCFTETTFSMIADPLPDVILVDDIYSCDDNGDGFTDFDLTNISNTLINGRSDVTVQLSGSDGNLISISDYVDYTNLNINQDYIKAVVTHTPTGCFSDVNINLRVDDNPVAIQPQIIYGCDDNNDGISEYFDTSNVERQVLNNQSGMSVHYYDQNGNELPSPLPNPYTNITAFNDFITIRVTDNVSTCQAETTLELTTLTQPAVSQFLNLYACDQGNGYAEFDTTTLEQMIIGNQTGLTIYYSDADDNPLPSPLPLLFQNTTPYSQTINARIEVTSNPICFSETSIELTVNNLPEVNLENEYSICNLEPFISLNVPSGFESYTWLFEDGTLISDTHNAEVAQEGNYTLIITQVTHGISCENSFSFTLNRSALPEIQQVNSGELGNNFIEIFATGDGDFEYSIDGINYQNDNYFSDLRGGIYTVFVRDKDGCGKDSEEVTLIDYPKFFTPNDDGFNDLWQIKGIANFPDSEIFIFDRYGKLLTQLSPSDAGWNGHYNGELMISNDYWFSVKLGNGATFSGHFTLKR